MARIHLIGNAHLDPAWLWRWEEGLEAFLATCRSALDRIEETPSFVFTCSSAAHYSFVEETDPILFERIRSAVQEGRWSVVGGWWVEADCNIPSGESFIRQGLYGQEYFLSRFGRIATVGYNIDSFGHNNNLPQLLSKCGLKCYIWMRPQEHEKHLQENNFIWVSPSGDRVVASRIQLHYSNFEHSSREKISLLHESGKLGQHSIQMLFFGVGNHGGGPTRAEIADILELQHSENDTILFSTPEQFVKEFSTKTLTSYTGELQPHAIGAYSAHAAIKKNNRFAERALVRAEKFSMLAQLLGAGNSTMDEVGEAWRKLCFTQFHDTLGGVSIPQVNDDTVHLQHEALSAAEWVARIAIQSIASNVQTLGLENLIIFGDQPAAAAAQNKLEPIKFGLWNPLASEAGRELTTVVLKDKDGTEYFAQKVESPALIGEDRPAFVAQIPQVGFGWYTFEIDRSAVPSIENTFKISEQGMSNGRLAFSLSFDSKSDIVHQSFAVYNDPSDTWAHGLIGFNDRIGKFEVQSVSIEERGQVRARMRIISKYNASILIEDAMLYKDSDYIEICYRLDWREHRKIARLEFAPQWEIDSARFETPYCTIDRTLSEDEVPGQNWVRVQDKNEENGVLIVTDCKSSFSVDKKRVRIVAARSAIAAHHSPPHDINPNAENVVYLDQGVQEFRVWYRPFKSTINCSEFSAQVLHSPIVHHESGHAGTLPERYEAISVSKSSIIVSVLKEAESGQGFVVRAFESEGCTAACTFRLFAIGLEWNAEFRPFEIKTFLVTSSTGGWSVQETSFLERLL